ncbi:hypothetical protein [Aestuariivirga sp.]|uniref:hypothetical protein n=1 Tax=Aestuariivirga sp. TaxID=2650926 RepID=UPI0039E6EECD
MATINSTTTPSRFHNLSPTMLADLIGELDRKAKAATAELDAAKDAFKARGILIAEGDAFAVMMQKSIRQTLDTTAVKAAMGQEWVDDHSKLAEVTSLRITACNKALAAA